jgi:hypothetical protein
MRPEIPKGLYCYSLRDVVYGPPTPEEILLAKVFGEPERTRSIVSHRTVVCPHWGIDPTRPQCQNGICYLTGLNDWTNHTMLWDQIKACSYNKK